MSGLLISRAMTCLTFFAFAFAIWPTPYTYQKVSRHVVRSKGVTVEEVWKINRLTGHACIVVPREE
jgi:hypothetical protein